MKKKVLFVSMVIFLVTIIILITVTRCSKKSMEDDLPKLIPFSEQYQFDYFSNTDEIAVPIYYYAEDQNKEIIKEDVIEFVDSKQKLTFSDFKKTKLEGSNNVIISYKIDMSSEIECFFNSNPPSSINFVFNYITPTIFDYYTGAIYHKNSKEISDSTKFKDVKDLKEDDFKFITTNWNDREYKIGVFEQSISNTEDSEEGIDIVDGRKHYKSPISSTIRINIMIPEDYDGIMLAIDKKGSYKEAVLKSRENKKNQTSNNDEQAEDEKDVKKLIDSEDESRKEYTQDRFYIMNISKINVLN